MIKKLIGLIAGLFGTVGTVLCIAAIMGIWIYKSALISSGALLLSPVESAFNRVDVAMGESAEMINNAQDKLKYGDPIPVAAAIAREIKKTQAAVSAAHQTVSGFDQMAGRFDTVSQVVSGVPVTELTAGVANHLGQFQPSFERIEGFAQSVGEGRPEATHQLSGELNQLQVKVNNVTAEVSKGKVALAKMASAIPEQMSSGALLLTFLLVWLGLGQFFMMLWGWRKVIAA